MVAGSWHNTVNLPACHMNGCLIYCLSNRNVANSESQGAVKSNTKNQMRSKHMPFLFFLPINKVPVLYMGMLCPLFACSFLVSPCSLVSLPFLGHHLPWQRKAKGCFSSIPKGCPHFLEGDECLFWDGHLGLSQNDCSLRRDGID